MGTAALPTLRVHSELGAPIAVQLHVSGGRCRRDPPLSELASTLL